jgi:hypothetical protein
MLLRNSQFRGEEKEMSHAHKGGFPRPAQRISTCHQKLGKSKQLLKHLRDTLSSERTDQSAPAWLRCTIHVAEMLPVTAEVTEKSFTWTNCGSPSAILCALHSNGELKNPESLCPVREKLPNAGSAIATSSGPASLKLDQTQFHNRVALPRAASGQAFTESVPDSL